MTTEPQYPRKVWQAVLPISLFTALGGWVIAPRLLQEIGLAIVNQINLVAILLCLILCGLLIGLDYWLQASKQPKQSEPIRGRELQARPPQHRPPMLRPNASDSQQPQTWEDPGMDRN